MSEAAVATAPKKQAAPPVTKPNPVQVSQGEAPHALKFSELQFAEFAFARFSVSLPVGWSFEETLKPEFWSVVAHRLQRDVMANSSDKSGAVIEIRTRDHAFYGELYVTAVQEKGLAVTVLREPVYFGPQEIPETGAYRAQWDDAKRGFDIIRKSDGSIVADGSRIKNRAMVKSWIDQSVH